jgi:hypothetical protein
VRLTELHARLAGRLGSEYADSWSRDFVLSQLGERTVVDALAAGYDAAVVWRAAADALGVPPAER